MNAARCSYLPCGQYREVRNENCTSTESKRVTRLNGDKGYDWDARNCKWLRSGTDWTKTLKTSFIDPSRRWSPHWIQGKNKIWFWFDSKSPHNLFYLFPFVNSLSFVLHFKFLFWKLKQGQIYLSRDFVIIFEIRTMICGHKI